MRLRVHRRLQQLETVQAGVDQFAAMQRRHTESEELLNGFAAFIDRRGLVQGPQESLREAFARALEISCSELDEQIERGVNPIYKVLADRGLLEEFNEIGSGLKEEKPPGLGPAAEGGGASVRL